MKEGNPKVINPQRSRSIKIKVPNKMFPEDFFRKSSTQSPTKSHRSCREIKQSSLTQLSPQITMKTHKYWQLMKQQIQKCKQIREKEQVRPVHRNKIHSEKKQRVNRLKQLQSPQIRPLSQLSKKFSFDQNYLIAQSPTKSRKKYGQPQWEQGLITFFGKSPARCLDIHLPPIK